MRRHLFRRSVIVADLHPRHNWQRLSAVGISVQLAPRLLRFEPLPSVDPVVLCPPSRRPDFIVVASGVLTTSSGFCARYRLTDFMFSSLTCIPRDRLSQIHARRESVCVINVGLCATGMRFDMEHTS